MLAEYIVARHKGPVIYYVIRFFRGLGRSLFPTMVDSLKRKELVKELEIPDNL